MTKARDLSKSTLPSQSGNSGKYLTTDGTSQSWGTPSSGGITLISTTTASGSSISLTSIPQTYKNLYIVYNSLYASAESLFSMTVNGDSGTNYYSYMGSAMFQSGFESAGTNSAASNIYINNINTNTNIGYQGSGIIDFYDYTSTSPRVIETRTRHRGSAYYYHVWTNTQYSGPNAISSIQINLNSGTFSGGTIKLYGVN